MNIILVNKNLLDVSEEMLKVIEDKDLAKRAKKAISAAKKVSVNEDLTNQVIGSIRDITQTEAVQDVMGRAEDQIVSVVNNAITKILSGKKKGL